MAFLEALGRSNALSSVNNVLGKAIELRQGEDKAAERAYTMGMQAEELGIHKAAAEREQKKFAFEESERQKKLKEDTASLNYRLSPQYLSSEPEGQKIFDTFMQKNGYANSEGVGQTRDIRKGTAEFFSDKDRAQEVLHPSVLKWETKAQEAFQTLSEAQATGDAAKIQKAQQAWEITYKQALLSRKNFAELGKLLTVKPEKVDGPWVTEPRTVGGKQILIRRNTQTGKEEQVSAGPMSTTVNVDTGLTKAATAKAQEEIQEGVDLYTGLENMVKLAKPEFHTYVGRAQVAGEKVGEKAGVLKNPKMLKEYTAWSTSVEQEFNKYRKWSTGVSASPEELEMIRKTFPNKDMSRTEFMETAKQTAITEWKLVERRRRALEAGIMDDKKQKEFYKTTPLDSMPDPPPEFLARFSTKRSAAEMSNDDLLRELMGGTK